jgi:ribosomal protein S18 acetylase RimI-like enzyme
MEKVDGNLEIEPINESSLRQVLQVYRDCEDFLARGPAPKATREMVRADLEESTREHGKYCGIYNSNGRMIGIVDYVSKGFEGNLKQAYISLIMIAARERGKGYGKMVITDIEKRIRADKRVTVIAIAVQTNNKEAIIFWKKMGYRIVSQPEHRPDRTTVFRLQKDIS